MFKSTIQVTLFSIFGIAITFLIQLLLAYFFGATEDRDAYYAALTIPAYVALLFTGSIGMLLVPNLIRHSVSDSASGKQRLISTVLNFSIVVLVIIAVLSSIFAYPLVKIIVPSGKPQLLDTAVYLFRILMFSCIFTVLNNYLSSAYQSENRFFLPSMSLIITNITSLVSVALFSTSVGIGSIAYGTLAGGTFAFLYLFSNAKKKLDFRWRSNIISSELVILLRASFPLFATGILFRLSSVFERYFAARLPEGSLTYVGNANQIIVILSSLVSTGIATTSFTVMSRQWAGKDFSELENTFLKVLNIIVLIVLPMIAVFYVSGEDLIRIFFEHGAFTFQDTEALYYTLLGFMGFFLFSSMGNVTAKILYLSNHTRAAGLIATAELLIYILASAILSRSYGYVGLAVSMSIASAFNIIASLLYIHKKIITVSLLSLASRTAAIIFISLVVILPALWLNKYVLNDLGSLVKAVVGSVTVILLFWLVLATVLKDRYYILIIDLIRNKIKPHG